MFFPTSGHMYKRRKKPKPIYGVFIFAFETIRWPNIIIMHDKMIILTLFLPVSSSKWACISSISSRLSMSITVNESSFSDLSWRSAFVFLQCGQKDLAKTTTCNFNKKQKTNKLIYQKFWTHHLTHTKSSNFHCLNGCLSWNEHGISSNSTISPSDTFIWPIQHEKCMFYCITNKRKSLKTGSLYFCQFHTML